MRTRILDDLVSAMKERDKDVLSVLRMVKGEIQLEEINVKSELTDEEVIQIILKQIKSRKESIVEFEKGNRSDLITKTEKEISILEKYLPTQLTEEEVTKIVDGVFNKINPTGKSDMGKIMKEIIPQVKGKADMTLVNKIITEKLNKIS